MATINLSKCDRCLKVFEPDSPAWDGGAKVAVTIGQDESVVEHKEVCVNCANDCVSLAEKMQSKAKRGAPAKKKEVTVAEKPKGKKPDQPTSL